MANVLEKIVIDKREELIAREAKLPLETFKNNLKPSQKSLYDALNQTNAGYIFECKKASPSKGLIRPVFDLDEILAAYTTEAAALSVLTDEKYFQGTYDYLQYVTDRVDIPVLNKDFFVNTYQVYLARHYNADAILLMLSVLSDEEYRELHDVADSLSLDVLTEVSNTEEAHRAVALGAQIIGINNRNLRDLSTDLAATEHLVPLLRQLGHQGVLISESGIYTRQDIARLAPLVDGFLVGSSLMAQENLLQAVQQLVYGTVKVCGITQIDHAQTIVQTPVSYLGLIFVPQSKRCVTAEQALHITEQVPGQYIGVFVNASIDNVVQIAKQCELYAVQLHGNEDNEYVLNLRNALPKNCQIWRAVGVTDTIPPIPNHCDRILLDCQVGEQSGGTGCAFDWSLLDDIDTATPIALAGGLSVDNIQEAIKTKADLLDLNSGVESAPGIKDINKINRVFELLRQY
jgi:indole-3-glycerol phosphate synthase/phosphoribosylanthranilate isomerase